MKKLYFFIFLSCLSMAAPGTLAASKIQGIVKGNIPDVGVETVTHNYGIEADYLSGMRYNCAEQLFRDYYKRFYRPPDPGIVCAAPGTATSPHLTGRPLFILVQSFLI